MKMGRCRDANPATTQKEFDEVDHTNNVIVSASSLVSAFSGESETSPRPPASCKAGKASISIETGRITLVGGGPGEGKTSFVHQAAFDAVLAGRANGLQTWCVELTELDIWRKQIARLSGVPVNKIPRRRQGFTGRVRRAYEQLLDVADDIEFLPDHLNLRQIYERDYCGEILIIDYIQRLRIDGMADGRARIDFAMARLREMASDGRAVVIVSSLARGRTGIDAFRESGELEYGADYAYVLQKLSDSEVMLTNVKNRWGALQDVRLSVDWPTMTFRDAPSEPTAVAADDDPQVWRPSSKRGAK